MKILNISLVLLSCLFYGCSTPNYKVEKYEVVGLVKKSEYSEFCYKKSDSEAGKKILGAFIGGLIGNQFGSGNGRIAMTILGAGTGAAVTGSSNDRDIYKCKSDGYENLVFFIDPTTSSINSQIVKTKNKKSFNSRLKFDYEVKRPYSE